MKNFIFKICVLFTFLSSFINYSQEKEQLTLLEEFLSIPNNANNQRDINLNLNWLEKKFNDLDFKTQILLHKVPYFYASKVVNTKLPTVLFYMHFDGQPVDSTKWLQENPFKPVYKLKDSGNHYIRKEQALKRYKSDDIRIYARSASDDKGPIVMLLSALNSIRNNKQAPQFNIKIILDSEEEKGSPNILSMIKKHKQLLQADYFVVFDGPMHDSGNPTLLYGVRGISALQLEVYGMQKPQHSGHYGNYGPNPVFRASQLLATMKDDDGKVLIDGYYNDIKLDSDIQEILNNVPDDENVIKQRAGFKTAEKVGNTYQEAMQYPSLNVRGIQSGWVGKQVRTIVPDKAIIELDLRTVPESHPDSLIAKIKNHIAAQGFTILYRPATKNDLHTIGKPIYLNYKHYMFPFRTNINSTIGSWLRKAVKQKDTKTVQIRISGGSVPLSFFINELNVPTVLVPLVNPDNNQHSPNENLKLTNFFEGIKTIRSILTTTIN